MTGLLMTHAEYELRHEDEATYAKACEEHRQMAYRLRHGGSLDGYRPPREFPCVGSLWQQPGDAAIREVWCDRCDFVTSLRVALAVNDDASPGRDW